MDDYQLPFPVKGSMRPLVHEQIEQDRQELLAEAAKPVNMTKDQRKSSGRVLEASLRYQISGMGGWCQQTMGLQSNPTETEADEGYSSESVLFLGDV